MMKFVPNICAVLVAFSGTAPHAPAATVPVLIDTIEPLPGPPCILPQRVALNNTTKRLYVAGGYPSSLEAGAQGRLSVVDMQSKNVIKNLSLPFTIWGLAINEVTNTVYLSTSYAGDGPSSPSTVILDGATNTIKGQVDDSFGVPIPDREIVDPSTGRIFAIFPTIFGHTLSVSKESDLSKIADIDFVDGSRRYVANGLALNSPTGKLYVSGTEQVYLNGYPHEGDHGMIAVIDTQSLALSYVQNASLAVYSLVVDSSLDRAFAFARVSDGELVRGVILVVEGGVVTQRIDLPPGSVPLLPDGATVDVRRHRAYFSDHWARTYVIDTEAKSFVSTIMPTFTDAAVLSSTGKIYAVDRSYLPTFTDHNAVGVIDPATSNTKEIAVGYQPFKPVINTLTGRLYVTDSAGTEMLAFNVANHSLVARIPVGGTDYGKQDLAVSAGRNRLYVTRSRLMIDGTTLFLDVYDGFSHEPVTTIPVSSAVKVTGLVAVDDTRHRVYVAAERTGQDSSPLSGIVYVLSADSFEVLTSFSTLEKVAGLGVNPVNGKLYLAGSDSYGGYTYGQVQIFNPDTLELLLDSYDAGGAPGPMAFNAKTNKVFVANGGDYSGIAVIDDETNSVETWIENLNEDGSADPITAVAVDQATNILFASQRHMESSVEGYVTSFDAASSDYPKLGSVDVGRSPRGVTFDSASRQIFVTNEWSGNISVLDAGPPPTPTHSGNLGNISSRMRVLTNEKALIGGFIITGPSGSTKKVLVRGMGPTLGKAGVPGSLSDPLLELHLPDGSAVTNDDWQQATNHDQIPQNFQPDPKEAALLVDLAPGAYTVIEKGAHDETGIGLTEVYDFDGGDTISLANISTRGFVDTGDNVMIGGFIVSGSEPAQILVRATGPSLAQFGVHGVLADPVLEMHDANGDVFLNDDWRETQEAEIIATTIPPGDDKEPAILVTLSPGSYTAIVRGKDSTTGVGLVEAYKIK